jgi:hypothetical protein
MSDFPFINDLCESHLIPSKTSLKQWKSTKLSELSYLYFIRLRILLASDTKAWANKYCDDAGDPNDFEAWRTSGNDLYAMLHALVGDAKMHIDSRLIRHWLRHCKDEDDTRRLFMRLDGMFAISNSSMRAIRRAVTEWDDVDERERESILVKLIQMIHTLAPSNSELLPHLKILQKELDESASAGATGAANVATVAGGLGAGFDPKGGWRSIYSKKKPIVLRRV